MTNKIKPFCDFLEYSELYCEQDLAEYLETEPGRPYWINGYWLKSLKINIFLFSFVFFIFKARDIVFYSENNKDVPSETNIHIASNPIYSTNLSFFSLFYTFLIIYLPYFLKVLKRHLFFLSFLFLLFHTLCMLIILEALKESLGKNARWSSFLFL